MKKQIILFGFIVTTIMLVGSANTVAFGQLGFNTKARQQFWGGLDRNIPPQKHPLTDDFLSQVFVQRDLSNDLKATAILSHRFDKDQHGNTGIMMGASMLGGTTVEDAKKRWNAGEIRPWHFWITTDLQVQRLSKALTIKIAEKKPITLGDSDTKTQPTGKEKEFCTLEPGTLFIRYKRARFLYEDASVESQDDTLDSYPIPGSNRWVTIDPDQYGQDASGNYVATVRFVYESIDSNRRIDIEAVPVDAPAKPVGNIRRVEIESVPVDDDIEAETSAESITTFLLLSAPAVEEVEFGELPEEVEVREEVGFDDRAEEVEFEVSAPGVEVEEKMEYSDMCKQRQRFWDSLDEYIPPQKHLLADHFISHIYSKNQYYKGWPFYGIASYRFGTDRLGNPGIIEGYFGETDEEVFDEKCYSRECDEWNLPYFRPNSFVFITEIQTLIIKEKLTLTEKGNSYTTSYTIYPGTEFIRYQRGKYHYKDASVASPKRIDVYLIPEIKKWIEVTNYEQDAEGNYFAAASASYKPLLMPPEDAPAKPTTRRVEIPAVPVDIEIESVPVE